MPDQAPTVGPIELFMVEDHQKLDRLLEEATSGASIDEAVYARFRHDLLRHIGMEEKVLLPDAKQRRGGKPLEMAAKLRADHGAIAKLLVPSPTQAIVDALRETLGRHNAIEEGENGLYAICDTLAGKDASTVVSRLRAQPNVPTAPHYDGPLLVGLNLPKATRGG